MAYHIFTRFFQIILFYKNWPIKVLNHRLLTSKQIILKLRNGLKFRIQSNSDDDGIVEELFTKEPYTPKGFQIKRGDIVFDIGAQKGVFTVYACSKGAKVYSYEPLPRNFYFLTENVKLNQYKAALSQLAVADKSGEQDFYMSKGSGSHSLFFKTNNSIRVKTTTLDAEIKKHSLKVIDILKLDCEGAEFSILYSAKNLRKIRKIAMEYHESEKNKITDLAAYLKKQGFLVEIKKNYLYAINKIKE